MSSLPPTNPPVAPNLITNPPRGEFDAIYTTYKDVMRTEKYYAYRLKSYQRLNKFYEIILAIGASTAIAGWAGFRDNPGKIFWGVFSSVVTVLVILKPILQIPKDIEDYTNLHTGYRALMINLRNIVIKIRRQEGLTPQVIDLFEATLQQYQGLSLKDEIPNGRLRARCEAEVISEIPPDSLWYPSILP